MFAGRRGLAQAESLLHWTAGFPPSRRLSRPWPRLRLRWLDTWLSAFGIGQPAFPAVEGYLARLTVARRRTAVGGPVGIMAWLRVPVVRVGMSRQLGRRDHDFQS